MEDAKTVILIAFESHVFIGTALGVATKFGLVAAVAAVQPIIALVLAAKNRREI